MNRLIIAGGRNLHISNDEIDAKIKHFMWWKPDTIVSGGAPGADKSGENYAALHGLTVARFLPDYKLYPPFEAPKRRNIAMAEYADALLAFWDGISGGTAHMIAYMTYLGKPYYIVKVGL